MANETTTEKKSGFDFKKVGKYAAVGVGGALIGVAGGFFLGKKFGNKVFAKKN